MTDSDTGECHPAIPTGSPHGGGGGNGGAPVLCGDGTVCHHESKCVERGEGVGSVCQCRVGWAGNGKLCGRDMDLDGIPDEALSACSEPKCAKVGAR